MSVIIQRLPDIIYPLTQVRKVNEIVDVINEIGNSSYTELNPALNPTDGVCTWTITHGLGTSNVSCTVYKDDTTVLVPVDIVSDDAISVSINSSSSIAAETYKITIVTNGGVSAGSGGGGGGSEMEIKTYFLQGLICNDDKYDNGFSTTSTLGYGNCTVTLFGSQKAQIEYSYTFTRRWTSDMNISWGINPNLLHGINSEVPVITPILGGSAFYYTESGSPTSMKTNGINGYGASNVPVTDGSGVKRWSFGRLYDLGQINNPPVLWYPISFEDRAVITGTCWGTIS